MRRSEREARLGQLAARLFAGAARVLVVGPPLELPGRALTQVATLPVLDAGLTFDGALVQLDPVTPVRAQLARVRRQLTAGACMLLTTPARPSAAQRARAMVRRRSPALLPLEPICEALLGLGLVAPRRHDDLPDVLLISSRVPRVLTELDALFEQPAVLASR